MQGSIYGVFRRAACRSARVACGTFSSISNPSSPIFRKRQHRFLMLKVLRHSERFPVFARLGVQQTIQPWHFPFVHSQIHSRRREAAIRCFGGSTSKQPEVAVTPSDPGATSHTSTIQDEVRSFAGTLPVICPGCGAFSQTVEPETPGFYSPRKRNLKKVTSKTENEVFEQAMARLATAGEAALSLSMPSSPSEASGSKASPTCDRCHDLIHQSKGQSILHPSMHTIQSIIESSPHNHNHIYHVLDAADFPMSLIPNLMSALHLPRLRTQNRRSKSRQYINGRVADVSFIITRSDLLAPQKEQVDRMKPYLQEVLRDALGRTGKNLRLGNVRCVSAKRGWWTPSVKQEIWERGGAGWVVGKVNVGKSALFESVYPKGRNGAEYDAKLRALHSSGFAEHIEPVGAARKVASTVEGVIPYKPHFGDQVVHEMNSVLMEPSDDDDHVALGDEHAGTTFTSEEQHQEAAHLEDDGTSLLPPAQPEMQYPHMPIVSSLPGTTASPIRIPFGNGKGELIDLPGVHRSSLETHIMPEHHAALVMKSRVVPDQYTLKPGQSMLIGGIIRLTPKTDHLVVLACPFTPLSAHVAGTPKAIAIQSGIQEDGAAYTGTVENIGTEAAKQRIKSAGTFKIEWDVTKKRAGPVTDKTAGKQKPENLPYIVYGADILIEGVGWIEITCQVRKRRRSLITDALSSEVGSPPALESRPEIEVFTPKGKFIGIRRPMNAWLTGGPKRVAKHARRSRPRMTISMSKRKEGGRKGGQRAYPLSI